MLNSLTTSPFGTTSRPRLVSLVVAALASCGSGDQPNTSAGASTSSNAGAAGRSTSLGGSTSNGGTSAGSALDIPYQPCAASDSVGRFRIELAEDYTLVQGQVFDAVEPSQIPVEVMSDSACQLLRPQVLLCQPACAFSTETCGAGGTCQPLPVAHDLGIVSVSGLVIPIEMLANERTKSYSNPASPRLPHPGFDAGAALTLQTAGGDYMALELQGWGISALVMSSEAIAVNPGQPTALRWEASGNPTPARIRVNLDINVHGSGGARIECNFPDSGSANIPATLVDALIAQGLSGFPTITVTRETLTSQNIEPGCVEFSVASAVDWELQVAGIVSCNTNGDCPADQTCLPIVRNCG